MIGTSIRASDLRERVELFKPVKTNNAFNETVETFVSAGVVYAEIEEGGGREFRAAERLIAEKRIRAKIWMFEGLGVTWRFSWNGMTFRIHDISEVRPRQGMVISGAQVV